MTRAGRRIARASVAVMAAHLLFKVAGLLQARAVIAFCAGDEALLDAFFFSFEIFLMAFYLIGEEGLGPAFLPVFMQERDRDGEGAAWRFASTVLSAQTLVLLCVTAAILLVPERIVGIMTETAAGTEAFARKVYLARWSAPALLGLSLGSTTYLILNGYKRFFVAALGDSALKFTIILAVLGGLVFGSAHPAWLVAGVVGGGAAKLLTHLLGIGRARARFRPRLSLKDPAVRKLLFLLAPLLVGIVFAKGRDVFNEGWVLSHLPEGTLSLNRIGRKLFQAVGQMLPYSVSIAMYPFFCEMVDRDDLAGLARILARSCRVLLALVVPLSALVIACALPLMRLLFQQEGFGLEQCRLAAFSTVAYTLVLPFFALEFVFMQTYFSNRRMGTPILLGVVFSALSMLLSYLGAVRYLEPLANLLAGAGLAPELAPPAAALLAVALAYTVSRILKVLCLGGLLKGVLPGVSLSGALSVGARMLLCGGVAYAAARGARSLAEGWTGSAPATSFGEVLRQTAPALALAGTGGLLAYLAALRLLCPDDWARTIAWTRGRLRARREGRG